MSAKNKTFVIYFVELCTFLKVQHVSAVREELVTLN